MTTLLMIAAVIGYATITALSHAWLESDPVKRQRNYLHLGWVGYLGSVLWPLWLFVSASSALVWWTQWAWRQIRRRK